MLRRPNRSQFCVMKLNIQCRRIRLALEILSQMVKQRKETISIYKKAGRNDLADQEDNEIKIILEFLPQKLTNGELKKIIEDTISATNSETIRDLGKVMAEIKNNYAGRCDLAEVSNILRKRLGG